MDATRYAVRLRVLHVLPVSMWALPVLPTSQKVGNGMLIGYSELLLNVNEYVVVCMYGALQ